MAGIEHIKVEADEAGMRLDRWFKIHYPGLGFGQLQKLLRSGQVRVDGGRVKPMRGCSRGRWFAYRRSIPTSRSRAARSDQGTSSIRKIPSFWPVCCCMRTTRFLFSTSRPALPCRAVPASTVILTGSSKHGPTRRAKSRVWSTASTAIRLACWSSPAPVALPRN